jgi:hypothetical protein
MMDRKPIFFYMVEGGVSPDESGTGSSTIIPSSGGLTGPVVRDDASTKGKVFDEGPAAVTFDGMSVLTDISTSVVASSGSELSLSRGPATGPSSSWKEGRITGLSRAYASATG